LVIDINFIFSVIMQVPGLAPRYTTHPIFPDMVSAMIVSALISIGMNCAFAMLRKKTTDMGKMTKVMKETSEWRKQYTDAIRKQDKVRVEELKKKQAYVNKMTMEMQQQQMRPMLIYLELPQPFLQFIFHSLCVATKMLSLTSKWTRAANLRELAVFQEKFFFGDGF
jgi:uncharacterized membrane protein (DUF106 family)